MRVERFGLCFPGGEGRFYDAASPAGFPPMRG